MLSGYEDSSNTNNHSLQPRYAEEHLQVHSTLNLETGGLQEQMTTVDVTIS